ncbi:CD151 antigen-like [Mercenaria mercenaria]|uniref:CD151 antigen-like n=1 Tax=Mercenaria mercenaria TaxID=6596 RepID=UPI00234E6968|nr:CD151 antigen-like [Mercenaria mercenaria]
MKMCSETVTKILLVIFNLFFVTAGLATAGIGIYVLFTREQFEELIGSSLINVGAYIAIAGGGIVVFIALAGCVGALTESRKLLLVYIICLVLVFIIEAAAGILGFLYYDKIRAELDDRVKKALLDKYGYEEYNAVTEGINILQQKINCCGYTEPEDWSASAYYTDADTAAERGTNKVPISCCKDMLVPGCNDNFDDKIHSDGCVTELESILKTNLMIVGAVCLSVAMIQLIGIVLSIVLWKKTKEQEISF